MKTKDTVIEQFKESIKYKRYSHNTIRSYSDCIFDLINFYPNVNPSKITAVQIKDFINFKVSNGISRSYQNIYINAVNLWQREMYKRKNVSFDKLRPRKENLLPKHITEDQIILGFSKIKNKKHKAICALMYLCGLRVGEVIDCKIDWFNRFSQEVIIKGKGGKERKVLYSDELKSILNSYFKIYNPDNYLFRGKTKEKYTTSSIRKITKRYFGINPHGLRHSFAVNLLKNGVDIYRIKELLGHDKVTTTEIYLKLDTSDLEQSRNILRVA